MNGTLIWRRSREKGGLGKDSGFLGTGHYPIPVLEEPMGLASRDTVIFSHDADHIYEVLDLAFSSILNSPQHAIDMAVADMKKEHYQTVRERMGEKIFSLAVMDVLRHVRPDIQVLSDARVGAGADFGITCQSREVFVETRWRPGSSDQSTRTELLRLIGELPADVGFLVVVDSDEPPSRVAYEVFENNLPTRGRILAWRERNGPRELQDALHSIIDVQVL